MAKKLMILVVIGLFMAIPIFSCSSSQTTLAPAFTLTNITGHKVNLADYQGQKAVLLLFFNFNIGTGQDPLLQSYLTRYRETQGLETFAVVNYAVLPEQGRQFMSSHAAQFPGGLGYANPLRDEDGKVSQAFGANPTKLTLVLVDQASNISFRQEVMSMAADNAELARHISEITK
jgi:peroxiredoxin